MSTNKKQIIKLSPEQVFRQILANSRLANAQHTVTAVAASAPTAVNSQPSLNTIPPFLEMTCGLFSTDELNKSIAEQTTIDEDFSSIFDGMKLDNETFEECQPLTDYLLNNLGSQELNWYGDSSDEAIIDDDTTSHLNDSRPTLKEKSKFAQKLENANLRIKIESPHSELCNKNLLADLSNPIVNEADFSTLITPGVEKTFNQLMKLIPTSELVYEPANEDDESSMMLFGTKEEQDWTHVTQTSPLSDDHTYIKPEITFCLNNEFTNDSLASAAITEHTLESTHSSMVTAAAVAGSTASAKNKRPRGVYRKDDIKTEEDRENYILRRKKNNMSSKVSRANKKASYKDIDSKIDFLFNSNQKMNRKISKLENINKIIKDMLVERLAKNGNNT